MEKPPDDLKIGKKQKENNDPKLAKLLKNTEAAKVHLQVCRNEAREAGLEELLDKTINELAYLAGKLYNEMNVPFQAIPSCNYD